MIASSEITVIMQGDIRPETADAIKSVRQHLPDARLILSTFHENSLPFWSGRVDHLVVSDDPGALPPYTTSRSATKNNLNRQIASTRAGLACVRTPYALKMRTDCVLTGDAFVRLFEVVRAADPTRSRLVASTYFTRHPAGISGYLFHVSDWFMFGESARLIDFWNVAPMSLEDATWFDSRPHQFNSTPAARRFRARFTPEQHISIQFAKRHGYAVPSHLNERHPMMVADATLFLANEFIIDSPDQLGFALPKYAHLPQSLYQEYDCVSYADWRRLFEIAVRPAHNTQREAPASIGRVATRWLARRARHILSAGGLFRRWVHAAPQRARSFFNLATKENHHA